MKETYKTSIEALLSDGREHTAKELAGYAMIKESSDTCPKTRGLVRELINDGNLIGSTRGGYKLMTTGHEVQTCLNSLLKRQIGIINRIQAVYSAAQSKGIL